MNVRELAQFLENNGCQLHGCATQEVNKIERHFAVKLPRMYVDFLLYMGKNAGKFMKGSSAFYDEIFDLRQGSIELLSENNFKPLPLNTFVFWMHQGYQFAFFYLRDGDNPPIYYYSEAGSKNDFEKKENTYTDFLESQLIMSGLR